MLKGPCKSRLFSFIAFVMDRKVLGSNCDGSDRKTDRHVFGQNFDGRTCFWMKMGMENFGGDGKWTHMNALNSFG